MNIPRILMKMRAIMRRMPIIRPTMIQKNPGMILHGRDIIQYKRGCEKSIA